MPIARIQTVAPDAATGEIKPVYDLLQQCMGMRKQGCSDEEILEATVVAALFNYMDRLADALAVQTDPWSDQPPPNPQQK